MNKSLYLIISAIILLIGSRTDCPADVESTIGKFSFAESAPILTEPEIISNFGKGYKTRVAGIEKRIYYSPKENLWLELSFSHVLNKRMQRSLDTVIVTKERKCDESFTPKTIFEPFITSKGVKIGDSFEKVIRQYGKPTVFINLGKDKIFSVLQDELNLTEGKILRYLNDSNELLFSEFYFKNGKLHSMMISFSE